MVGWSGVEWKEWKGRRGRVEVGRGLSVCAVQCHLGVCGHNAEVPHHSLRRQRLTYLCGVVGQIRVMTPSHTHTHPSHFFLVRAGPVRL